VFKTLHNAWKIPDLRKKLMFTLLILLLYRIGNVIPIPYIDVDTLGAYFDSVLSNTILGLYNAMSGSAFSMGTIFALSIQPYINASIIIQLLTIALPFMERWAKEEGEEGKKKIETATRICTVVLGLLMGWAYYMMIKNQAGILTEKGFLEAVVIILTFTAGSAVVMWLGEQITAHGIGNGISMILFANIISSIPSGVTTIFSMFTAKIWWQAVIAIIGVAALIILIVFVNDAERRIPVQYAKRVVGRKIYGGQSTNLPIKVAMSGVMPVIFAQSICSLPATVCTFFGWTRNWAYLNLFQSTNWAYIVFYFLMIFFFSWFYASIQYDPVEISNNLKKNGGFIPGFRPGKPTSDFIKKVINKIIVFGAVYLAIVALLPLIAGILMPNFQHLAIGGTSVIIVVGVALETVKALEAQMLMRHYKGFLD
jgi:preprotein translocase subunit SecY